MNGPVSVVGVGNMGGAIAANLLARGLSVQVCDLGRRKSGRWKKKGVAPPMLHQGAIKPVATVVCLWSTTCKPARRCSARQGGATARARGPCRAAVPDDRAGGGGGLCAAGWPARGIQALDADVRAARPARWTAP